MTRASLWRHSRRSIRPCRIGPGRRACRRSRLAEIARGDRALPFDQPVYAHVVHVRIGGKTDTLESAPRLREHEGAIARDLVPNLVVAELLRREAPSVFGDHDDVPARFHLRLARVVRALISGEHGVSL